MKKLLLPLIAILATSAVLFSCRTSDDTLRDYICHCNYVYKTGSVTTDTIATVYTIKTTRVEAQYQCEQKANKTNPDAGHTLYQQIYCSFE